MITFNRTSLKTCKDKGFFLVRINPTKNRNIPNYHLKILDIYP